MAGWGSALLAVAAAGCNQVYGLEPTVPEPPDPDGDRIFATDNCPLTPNPDQLDTDADTFGDACDVCPGIATPSNHDEDGDLRGDDCDLCAWEPDFQGNVDNDDVGDACDLDVGTANTLVYFEPFLDVDAWTSGDVEWRSTGDSAAPVAALAGTSGLALPEIALDGTRRFHVRLGLLSTRTWRDGDLFGIALLDASGTERARCAVTCAAGSCRFQLAFPDGMTNPYNGVVAVPLMQLRLDYTPTAGGCQLDQYTSTSLSNHTPLPNVHPVLVAQPDIQLRYFATWQ